MTLLDATPYDPGPARRRKIRIFIAVIVILVLAAVGVDESLLVRRAVVDKFFAPSRTKTTKLPMGFIMPTRSGKRTRINTPSIRLNQFIQDWGPGGQWGADQKLQSEWLEHLFQRSQRRCCGCDRQPARRACSIVGGEIRQDAEPAALRTPVSVTCLGPLRRKLFESLRQRCFIGHVRTGF